MRASRIIVHVHDHAACRCPGGSHVSLSLAHRPAAARAHLGFVATGLVATSASAVVEPKIWGVVLDGKGKPVLDVVVTAVDEDGKPAATDLSYEGGTAEDSPRQGYFALMVGSNGTYTVTLKKAGFVTEKVTGIEIAGGQRVEETWATSPSSAPPRPPATW